MWVSEKKDLSKKRKLDVTRDETLTLAKSRESPLTS